MELSILLCLAILPAYVYLTLSVYIYYIPLVCAVSLSPTAAYLPGPAGSI